MAEDRRTYQRRGQQVASPLAYAHVQPHASEVEMAVLGALMIDKVLRVSMSQETRWCMMPFVVSAWRIAR